MEPDKSSEEAKKVSDVWRERIIGDPDGSAVLIISSAYTEQWPIKRKEYDLEGGSSCAGVRYFFLHCPIEKLKFWQGSYSQERGIKGILIDRLANSSISLQAQLDPKWRKALDSGNDLLIVGDADQRMLKEVGIGQTSEMVEVHLITDLRPQNDQRSQGSVHLSEATFFINKKIWDDLFTEMKKNDSGQLMLDLWRSFWEKWSGRSWEEMINMPGCTATHRKANQLLILEPQVNPGEKMTYRNLASLPMEG